MTVYDGLILTVIGIGIIVIIVSILYSRYEQQKMEINRVKKDRTDDEKIEYDDVRQKIIELNEYGEYLKAELDKKHKELLFLYQMVLEKQKEINISHLEVQMGKETDETLYKEESIPDKLEEELSHHEPMNYNEAILALAKEGKSSTQIAKQLHVGKGQVDLVLNLYH